MATQFDINHVLGEAMEPTSVARLNGAEHTVFRVLYLPNSQLILAASYDSNVRIYDPENAGEPCSVFEHSNRVRGITPLFDDLVASVTVDGLVVTWNATSADYVALLQTDVDLLGGPTQLCKLNESQIVMSTAAGYLVLVSHDKGTQLVNEKQIQAYENQWIRDVAINKGMVATCAGNSVRVWDADTLNQIGDDMKHSSAVRCMAFNDAHLVVACEHEIHVRRNEDGFPLECTLPTQTLNSITFLSSDMLLLTTTDNRLCFLSLKSRSYCACMENPEAIEACQVLENGQFAVAGDSGYCAIISAPEQVKKAVQNAVDGLNTSRVTQKPAVMKRNSSLGGKLGKLGVEMNPEVSALG